MDEQKKIIEIGFRKWRAADVESKLSVVRLRQDAPLDEWLKVSGEIPPQFQAILNALRENLSMMEGSWNEFDLIGYFVGPLFALANFRGKYYNGFYHRNLSVTFENRDTIYEAAGFVDWMAASGIAEPERPYFFLTEYKRQSMAKSDPLGQLLIAMLAAQQRNADGRPLYGAYIIGSSWRFVRLFEKNYSISKTFDASNEDDFKLIWLVLQKTKAMIEAIVAEISPNYT